MATKKLTDAIAKALPWTGRAVAVRDTTIKGFMVVRNRNSATWCVQADLWEPGARGERRLLGTRRITLGKVGELTCDKARVAALEALSALRKGTDPRTVPEAAPEPSELTLRGLMQAYAADMQRRQCQPRSVADMLARQARYLPNHQDRPLRELKRSTLRAEHERISTDHGTRVANMTLREVRAAWNLLLRQADDPASLPPNGATGITWHRDNRKDAVLKPDELKVWWEATERLSPLRRLMHRFGLLSGLRPGNLMGLRRSWINWDAPAVVIPRTKAGRPFALPCSPQMVEILREALRVGDVLYGDRHDFVFPTRARNGDIVACTVIREPKLPSQTGHILRHTHRTLAALIGVPRDDAMLLLDHTVSGISGVYLHERVLFSRLITAQVTLSNYITKLTTE